MDKCDSHDESFRRLYAKIEGMDDKLERISCALTNRLHDGDVRFVQIEMRLDQTDKAVTDLISGRTDLKQRIVTIAFDLIRFATVGVLGAACWAFMNGYKG
ncbi:MAG: hypothetical protein LUC93_05705 [Planctomycetaceae bacterium]|nr:hypothetical protein [Planctomycetaceae bacterium]